MNPRSLAIGLAIALLLWICIGAVLIHWI